MSKFDKIKKWTKTYKEEIALTGMVAGIAALYGGLVVLAIKAEKKQAEADAAAMLTVTDAVSRGATVLPGPDGYWIIENQG